jgi:hypothetical protein
LPFGFSFVAPAFFVAGAAFLGVAFVAILINVISPSHVHEGFEIKDKEWNLTLKRIILYI